jgi:hypothetical protein
MNQLSEDALEALRFGGGCHLSAQWFNGKILALGARAPRSIRG